ncbi:MAG: hypothetical protein ACJ8DI_08350 [Ktedonobacteraceae bacterium]
MIYQPAQSSLPPWFATPHVNPKYPPMEPLAPNPRLAKQPAAQQRTTKKQQARPESQTRRASMQQVHARLVQVAQEQPRDQRGRFAEKGRWFSWLIDPTPRPPTHLKPLKPTRQKRPLTAPPRARTSKRRRKKPVPERGFFGRVFALFNGDYARWKRANLRQQARLRMQIDGYAPPPKRRRRKKSHQARRMSRRDAQGQVPGMEVSLQALPGE